MRICSILSPSSKRYCKAKRMLCASEAGAIILKMAYGYTIEPHKRDPLVDIADEALLQFSAATVPGAWLVDTIPLCQLFIYDTISTSH